MLMVVTTPLHTSGGSRAGFLGGTGGFSFLMGTGGGTGSSVEGGASLL
jgi:hypothetical protein